jgi:hypothetical protein
MFIGLFLLKNQNILFEGRLFSITIERKTLFQSAFTKVRFKKKLT